MPKVKSFATVDGDMFYINHKSDNFTIIDCCIEEEKKEEVLKELKEEKGNKRIIRFISTHPDDDHIRGLKYLMDNQEIPNFYCVKNSATKTNPSEDFKKYCSLRDDRQKAFYLEKGCERRWMNLSSNERDDSGINIKWPDINNKYFKEALQIAKEKEEPNNICPIITYSIKNNVKIYWLGDLEDDYMENIKEEVEWEKGDIVFAPHHGRDSGKLPQDVLEKIEPKVIIIGNAESESLNYYQGYETITQNTAGDIIIMFEDNSSNFYVSNENYDKKLKTLKTINANKIDGYKYIGSLTNDK